MIASLWGDSDSESDNEDVEKSEICMTTLVNHRMLFEREKRCFMAKTKGTSSQQVCNSTIREQMYNYDKGNLLEFLETMLDQCLELSNAYKTSKKL